MFGHAMGLVLGSWVCSLGRSWGQFCGRFGHEVSHAVSRGNGHEVGPDQVSQLVNLSYQQ